MGTAPFIGWADLRNTQKGQIIIRKHMARHEGNKILGFFFLFFVFSPPASAMLNEAQSNLGRNGIQNPIVCIKRTQLVESYFVPTNKLVEIGHCLLQRAGKPEVKLWIFLWISVNRQTLSYGVALNSFVEKGFAIRDTVSIKLSETIQIPWNQNSVNSVQNSNLT